MKKHIFHNWYSHSRGILMLALPLSIAQLSQLSLGLADTVMVGATGTAPLGAVAFVNVWVPIFLMFSVGVATAVSAQVSYAFGQKDARSVAEVFRHGVLLALIFGIFQCVGLFTIITFLDSLGQPEDVIALAPSYLRWVAFSLPILAPTLVMKSFSEALNHPWPVFFILMFMIVLNIALNAVLIFGLFGFPELGLTGAGIATFISRVMAFIAAVCYVKQSKYLANYRPQRWLKMIERTRFMSLFQTGIFIGGQGVISSGVFSVGSLLVGLLGTISLAAHQITLTWGLISETIPVGISMAVTIRISNALGRGNIRDLFPIWITGQLIGLLVTGAATTVFFTHSRWLAAIVSPDPEVIDLSVKLLIILGIYQVFNGIQTISMGALRGFEDVRLPAFLQFVALWLVALPAGAVLVFYRNYGISGLWYGLVIGFISASLFLTARFWFYVRKLRRGSTMGLVKSDF